MYILQGLLGRFRIGPRIIADSVRLVQQLTGTFEIAVLDSEFDLLDLLPSCFRFGLDHSLALCEIELALLSRVELAAP